MRANCRRCRRGAEAAAQAKSVYGLALPGLSDDDWLDYAHLGYRENAAGIPVPDMDPKISEAFKNPSTAVANLWPLYAQIKGVPMLVIRGALSDLLSAATVERMVREKPGVEQITVANRGHTPLLNEPECVAVDRSIPDSIRNSGGANMTRVKTKDLRLKDQVALVTGAASGIGKEIARAFARAGAKLAIADLNRAGAELVAEQIIAEGGAAVAISMDVTNEAEVEAGIAGVVGKFGRIDVLVSNAGVQVVAPLEQFKFDDWRRVLAIHLDGAFLCTRATLRQMYKQRSGSIVLMGSVHSKEASVLKAPYVTAKHGLLGLAKVIAKEGAKHGVRANVICPGFVRTPLVDKQIPEQASALGISEAAVIRDVMLKETVDGEFTTVEDVAAAALFFASFESNALTGQSLTVSHGWSMS